MVVSGSVFYAENDGLIFFIIARDCDNAAECTGKTTYWVGNLALSQKFGNFSSTNAASSKLLFVIFQYYQTVSLHPHMHRTV